MRLSIIRNALDRIAFHTLAALNHGRYRRYHVHGFTIFLNISESPMMLARARGRYDIDKITLLRRILKAGMVFVDVGANKGDFTLLAATLVGPTGIVHAFEPAPSNIAKLRQSIAANGLTNIRVHELALFDTSGEATLYLAGRRSGWHSLIGGLPHRDAGTISVPTRRLDDFDLGSVHAIKIDVEGSEQMVLEGARATLVRNRPIVLLDLHPDLGVDLAAVARFFAELDYSVSTTKGAQLARTPERWVRHVVFSPAKIGR
jgi:FkbM family methyltransferase